MSRVGNNPIPIPDGVEVNIEGCSVTVKGPKGELVREFNKDMKIEKDENTVVVKRPNDQREVMAMHGLTRSLLNNMVEGVSKGFEKKLELTGVGYRAQIKGRDLELQLGYSHPVVIKCPEGITFESPSQEEIFVKGIDKQLVGEIAANIRKQRPPEPYKGKGIKYEGEHIRRKLGKAAKTEA
ncbi:MAG: 50S ribosomal protein L6 [Coriobacteriia bacterium]|nr:50S ribosomal protein L6 [Coriobacteriia bacterium]